MMVHDYPIHNIFYHHFNLSLVCLHFTLLCTSTNRIRMGNWLVVWLTFFIFPYIGNNHPNWLIFFRGVAQPPTRKTGCNFHGSGGRQRNCRRWKWWPLEVPSQARSEARKGLLPKQRAEYGWFGMGFYGIYGYFMGSYGYCMGISWDFMGILWVFYGILWGFYGDFMGILWDFMGILCGFYGYFMVFYGGGKSTMFTYYFLGNDEWTWVTGFKFWIYHDCPYEYLSVSQIINHYILPQFSMPFFHMRLARKYTVWFVDFPSHTPPIYRWCSYDFPLTFPYLWAMFQPRRLAGCFHQKGVNNYGNIEVASGIPDGCVHVEDEAARMAAPKLGLEFAPAVISFRKERGQLKPVARTARNSGRWLPSWCIYYLIAMVLADSNFCSLLFLYLILI